VCKDKNNDSKNCGSCGNDCTTTGKTCVAGTCTLVCSGGTVACGGKCVDTTSDPSACGGCGAAFVCPTGQSCVSSACKLVCGGGTVPCGTVCSNLSSDPANCGACGKPCATGKACVGGACYALAAPPCNTGSPKVLFYGPVGSGEQPYLPAGSVVTIADATTWAAMTTANFSTYQMIVIGEQGYSSASQFDALFANRATWSAAVTGRVSVGTLDPVAHGNAGAQTWAKATLNWVATGPGTGLYVGPDYGLRHLDFMSSFGSWTLLGQFDSGIAGNDIHILVPSHGTMVGSTDASLSNWGWSYHGAITAFPAGFTAINSVTSDPSHITQVAKDVTCL